MSERRIALIGLGNMGGPIGSHWVSAGDRVIGFDLSEAAREAFRARGGETAESMVDAAGGAEVVVLLLPDSTVVDAVLADLLDRGALSEGSVVIDMSSSEPQHTQRNAALAAEHGVTLIDAPVSGGVAGAEAGTLTVMVGGETGAVEAHRELLEQLGTVVHVGEVGSGHAVKSLNNLLSAIHLWATSEAVVIGERFGVDPEVLLQVVNGSSGRSGSSEAKWPKFILTEKYDSGFSARLMLKDARIAAELASTLGLPTLLGEDAVAEWARAVAELPAGADHTEIARWIRERSQTLTP
jgi:3-hydroxyisobutyrate dehydrogenase